MGSFSAAPQRSAWNRWPGAVSSPVFRQSLSSGTRPRMATDVAQHRFVTFFKQDKNDALPECLLLDPSSAVWPQCSSWVSATAICTCRQRGLPGTLVHVYEEHGGGTRPPEDPTAGLGVSAAVAMGTFMGQPSSCAPM